MTHGIIHSSKRDEVATINQVVTARQEKAVWTACGALGYILLPQAGYQEELAKEVSDLGVLPIPCSTAMSGKKSIARVLIPWNRFICSKLRKQVVKLGIVRQTYMTSPACA